MTLLDKPFKRELPKEFDRHAYTVEFFPWGMSFKPKRSRKTGPFTITWEAVISRAIQAHVEAEREERKAKRKAKR
jgi:hypothetical protein